MTDIESDSDHSSRSHDVVGTNDKLIWEGDL